MMITVNLNPASRGKKQSNQFLRRAIQVVLIAGAVALGSYGVYSGMSRLIDYTPDSIETIQLPPPDPQDDLIRILVPHDKTVCYRDLVTRTMSCVYNPEAFRHE